MFANLRFRDAADPGWMDGVLGVGWEGGTDGGTDGRTDGRMEGRWNGQTVDGRTDGWREGWTDGTILHLYALRPRASVDMLPDTQHPASLGA